MLIEITYNVTDVFMSTTETPVYVEISFEQPGGSAAVWGSITGTLSNQTDLQNALNLKVPYTGATTNVNLGEYELKAGQVTLDTSPTGTAAVGTIRWNDTTGTSETTLKGGNVIIKNGVDLVARVVNKVTPNTTLTKAAYQAVRVSGAQGQRLAVALAQANNDANSADTIGLVTETIATNQEGFIMTVGQLEGINTTGSLQGETWVDGDVLYLSPTTAGAITNVQPTGAGHIVVIGYVEYAHANNGKIYVKVMNGWELDELHNVSIVTPTNNQGLFYNSSNSLWENKTISTVLGYTPEQPLTFNSPLSRAGNVVSIPQATGSVNGFLSATDWTTFNSKQNALGFTPANAATTLTINGVTFDLSANRSWTIAAGISGSGAAGQVTYWDGTSSVSGSNNLFWDNTNGRLGIGTNAPASLLDVRSSLNAFTGVDVRNSSAGNGARSLVRLYNDNGNIGQLAIFGSGTGASFANKTFFEASKDFVIGTDCNTASGGTSKFQVYVGGYNAATTPQLSFHATANLSIGSTADNGQRLQVYGDTLLRGSGATSATTALTVQNSSSTNLLTVRNDSRVGIATNAPTAALDIWNATDNAQLRISDNRVSIPSYSSTGFNPILSTNTLGFFATASSSTGGVQFTGFTSVNNSAFPFVFIGYHGGTSPTTPALTFWGFKHDGANNRTALTGSEIIAGFRTGSNADVFQVKANGRINMSSLPTSTTGLVAGDLWNDAGTVKIV